jgi:pimeloyl-ACP methyl ester carboxylesterase
MNTGEITNPVAHTNTLAQNAQILGQYIDGVRQQTGAELVALVVHSMGGMISRYYIDRVMQGRQVGQLIMLGSPMGGSDCSVMPAALGFFLPASLEIRSSYMNGIFNRQITHRHGIQFHDLAGTAILEPYQSPCTDVPNDTVVSFGSVNAIPLESSKFSIIHSELTLSQPVFEDFVQPLLTKPAGGFAPSPDSPSSAEPASSLEFTRVYTGHVETGGSAELNIRIDADVAVASFALYDPTRSIDVSVRGASGNVIQLDPVKNGLIRIDDPSSMLYLGYGFSKPKPGPWKVTVLATDKTPASGADFAISVYFVGGAVLRTGSNTLIPRPGEQVDFTSSLSLGSQPLQITAGQVLIRHPDGTLETLDMQPGAQATASWKPTLPGTYGADVVITAQAPDGAFIERTSFLALEVQPTPTRARVTTNLVLVGAGALIFIGLILYLFIRLVLRLVRRPRKP